MGLWNQLTGKEDADKANKKAREAQAQNYEKIRREEYQSAVTASQLTNALMMSDIADNMAGRGITDEIRADYESRLSSYETQKSYNLNIASLYQQDVDFYNAGGGATAGRRKMRDKAIYGVQYHSNIAQATQPEIDRVEGILGTVN